MNHLHIIQLAQERAAELQGKRSTVEPWTAFASNRPEKPGFFARLRNSFNSRTPRTQKDNKRARS